MAIVACGPGDSVSEHTVRLQQAASSTARFSIRLPNAMVPQDVALAATDWLQVRDRATVRTASAKSAPVVNTGSGATDLGVEATVGDLWSQGRVLLRPRARVEGLLRTASTLSREPGSVVTGVITQNKPITPLRETSWEVTLPAATGGNVALEPDVQRDLAPGGYGHVSIKSRASLKLRAGIYAFESMMQEPQSHLVIDDSAGPVVVYVRTSFTFRGSIDQTRVPGQPSPDLLVVVSGSAGAVVEAAFKGTIVAPSGLVRLASLTHTGGFFGKQIEVAAGARIIHRPLLWSRVLPSGDILMVDAPVVLRASRQHPLEQAEDGLANPASPVSFNIPAYLPVKLGNAANGMAELSFLSTSQARVVCSFRGGSTLSEPVTDLERARGLRYKFVSCSNGLTAGAKTSGTEFRLRVLSGDANHFSKRTSIEAHLGEGCSGTLPPPMFPEEVVELRERFSWRTMPRLPDLDPQGRHALFHGAIYIDKKEQLAELDRLNVFWSALPLFREHILEYSGKCGKTAHAADFRGVFVFAIFPSKIFNMYRAAGIKSELTGIAPPIRAIIPTRVAQSGAFNTDDSLSYATLAETGYPAWLAARRAQQPGWFSDAVDWVDDNIIEPVTDVGSDIIGYGGSTWDGFVDFVVIGADDVWEGIQQGFQEIGFLFKDKVNVRLEVTLQNRDGTFMAGAFGTPMVRGWGASAGSKLLPFGANVRVRQWWGILPTMDQEALGPSGIVNLEALKDSSARGGAICIELDTDDGMMTSDFIPNEVCGFSGVNLAGFSHDTSNRLTTNHEDLNALAQIVDSAQYSSQVIQRDPHKIDVLTGWLANELSRAFNPEGGERAMCLCLDFPSIGQTALTAIIPILGNSSTAGEVLEGLEVNLALKDLWWPDEGKAVANLNSRGMMTHEYGHFSMCSLLFDEDGPSGLNGLLLRLGEPGDRRDQQIAVMTESLADAFAAQVVGGTNYFTPPNSTAYDRDNNMNYCFDAPCLDRNFRGTGDADGREFNDEIARRTTLMHDAFDSHTGSFRRTDNPWNGDVWSKSFNGQYPLSFSSQGYVAIADEFVKLPGPAWSTWMHSWIERGRTPDVENVLGGLSDAMAAYGFNWCQRCEVFAAHNPDTLDPSNPDDVLATPAQHFARWRNCVEQNLQPMLGPPPDPNLNLNAACEPCPAGQFSDGGTCRECPSGQVPAGDHCECAGTDCITCPAGQELVDEACVDCQPGQGTNGSGRCEPCDPNEIVQDGVCVACPAGQRADSTSSSCLDCPADAIVDWSTLPSVCNVAAFLDTSTSIAAPDSCPDEFWFEIQNVDQILGPLVLSTGPMSVPAEAGLCSETTASLTAYQPAAGGGWEALGSLADTGRFGGCASCVPACLYEDILRIQPATLAGKSTLRVRAAGEQQSNPIVTFVSFSDQGKPICGPD